MTPVRVDTVVLDVDGTMVDSVYVHVLAWCRAFQQIGTVVPSWRIHRAIGMGGDRLVAEVAGQRVEDALGDEVRRLHDEHYAAMFAGVRPLPGADELLTLLRKQGFTVVMTSSGTNEQTSRALDLLAANDVATAWVSGADVEVSEPAPDLLRAAMARAGARRAALIGDSVWDVRSAHAAGLPAIGMRCGGFHEAELRHEGAVAVFDSPEDLVRRFEESGLVRATD
jgi:HAD superfamily hydrolase (TIGR01509 family)